MQEATGQMKDANNALGIEEYSLDAKVLLLPYAPGADTTDTSMIRMK